jgi:endonuclease/exonuclease/phosphatase family metal-dependent hydrolase
VEASASREGAEAERQRSLRILTWNLYHGRDAPPGMTQRPFAERLLRTTVDDGTHLQVNRPLGGEFAELIAAAGWDVCLLQEVPPSWSKRLADGTGAQARRTLTSRNQLLPLTQLIGRINPDVIGSWEGGSNVILARPPWEFAPGGVRSWLLNPFRERGLGGERRRMTTAILRASAGAPSAGEQEACIANLHATSGDRPQAERELRRAARAAVASAGARPLVLGGDFNLQPAASAALFEELEREWRLTGATAPDAIDHLLSRGLEILEAPRRWPEERREIAIEWRGGSRRMRLSDHAPVEAAFATP